LSGITLADLVARNDIQSVRKRQDLRVVSAHNNETHIVLSEIL
jgi:Rrf2 family transcriptional regulator, iron-sulfur cluster assembly transcription factor